MAVCSTESNEFENDFLEFIDFVNERDAVRAPKRYIRDMLNPLEFFPEKEFLRRYRFTKATVVHILLPLINNNESLTKRGLPVPPIMKLLIALRFYATGCFQIVCGDLVHYSQPTVSRIIKAVSEELASNMHRFIYFPKTEEKRLENRNLFYGMQGFPGVMGCIDCTHVPIISPGGENAECFRNRKSWMSLNVQVICGPRMEILDIVTRWPGSTHDSRIFDNSRVKMRFEEGRLKGILLGDSGYPQLPYLFTPLLQPSDAPQFKYNTAHKTTRNLVERTFGVWKRRFPCLAYKLKTRLDTSTKVIVACAVLHNISVELKEPVPRGNIPNLEVPVDPIENNSVRGTTARLRLIQTHFT